MAQIHPGEKYSHALAWSQLQFDLCVQKALRGTPEENFASSVATIRDRILDYTQSIDDIEQRLEGSDYQLDELLTLEPEAKQTHPQAETSLVEIASQPTQNRVNSPSSPKKSLLSQQTPEKVEMWLGNWLHQKLKVNPATIQTSQSFADFGLDSIFAVELAQDLADWSGIPVEATIVWNYPTIDSLAEYLANQINQSNTAAESANNREKSEILAVLPQISEEEISAFFS
jgi:acyl carrier protein